MIDVHAFGNTSPKGAHWHAYDYEDSPNSVRRHSTFSRIASRLLVNRGTVERSTRRVVSEDSPINETKLRILATNPAIYERFRDGLMSEKFYVHFTHWGVSYSLQHFLDTELRIPDLKEEIIAHPLNRSRSRLFSYWTGDNSTPPTSKRKFRSSSVSPTSVKSASNQLVLDALCVPSLETTKNSEDDSDGIVSLDSLGDFADVCSVYKKRV